MSGKRTITLTVLIMLVVMSFLFIKALTADNLTSNIEGAVPIEPSKTEDTTAAPVEPEITSTTTIVDLVTAPKQCYVSGCSSQICSDSEDVISTCEWRSSYACFATARCEPQPDGECGWTPTKELTQCLQLATSTTDFTLDLQVQ